MRHRQRVGPRQLDLEWMERVRWSDLPADVRDEVREQLRHLLIEAARAAEGRADE